MNCSTAGGVLPGVSVQWDELLDRLPPPIA
jgi:hypothetical protein